MPVKQSVDGSVIQSESQLCRLPWVRAGVSHWEAQGRRADRGTQTPRERHMVRLSQTKDELREVS